MSGTQDPQTVMSRRDKKGIFVAGSGEECVWKALFETFGQRDFKKVLYLNCKKQFTIPHPNESSYIVKDLAASSGRKQQRIADHRRGSFWEGCLPEFTPFSSGWIKSVLLFAKSNVTQVRISSKLFLWAGGFLFFMLSEALPHTAERRLMWVCTLAHL